MDRKRTYIKLSFLLLTPLFYLTCYNNSLISINGNTMGTTYTIKIQSVNYTDVVSLRYNVDQLLENLNNLDEILSSVSGLPSVLIETYGIYTWTHAFDVLGVDYFKPRKITFGLRLDRNRTLLIIENSKEYYNKFSHNFFNDISEFKFGFDPHIAPTCSPGFHPILWYNLHSPPIMLRLLSLEP